MRPFFLFVVIMLQYAALAQKPQYTPKKFVHTPDTVVYKVTGLKKDGIVTTQITTHASYFDLDDNKSTYVLQTDSLLIYIEGNFKNGKRNGVFIFSIFENSNPAKKYKLWEQDFENDLLNGQWRYYALSGQLVKFETFKNGKLNGLSRFYWIDGRTIMEDKVFQNNDTSFIQKKYYEDNTLKSEFSITNGKLNGVCKKFYPNGTLQEYAEFKNDDFNGTRKYYYENGQLWIEQTYKDGKHADVIANFTKNGIKRDAGSLKNGNGTIIFYNDDGAIREVQNIINGVAQN